MKYRVGDKVRVRSDLREGYGFSFYVNDEMAELAGEIVEIASTGSHYNLKGHCYAWSDDMFEGLAPEEESTEQKITITLSEYTELIIARNELEIIKNQLKKGGK